MRLGAQPGVWRGKRACVAHDVVHRAWSLAWSAHRPISVLRVELGSAQLGRDDLDVLCLERGGHLVDRGVQLRPGGTRESKDAAFAHGAARLAVQAGSTQLWHARTLGSAARAHARTHTTRTNARPHACMPTRAHAHTKHRTPTPTNTLVHAYTCKHISACTHSSLSWPGSPYYPAPPPQAPSTCAILSMSSCLVASGSLATSSSMNRGRRSRWSSPSSARLICRRGGRAQGRGHRGWQQAGHLHGSARPPQHAAWWRLTQRRRRGGGRTRARLGRKQEAERAEHDAAHHKAGEEAAVAAPLRPARVRARGQGGAELPAVANCPMQLATTPAGCRVGALAGAQGAAPPSRNTAAFSSASPAKSPGDDRQLPRPTGRHRRCPHRRRPRPLARAGGGTCGSCGATGPLERGQQAIRSPIARVSGPAEHPIDRRPRGMLQRRGRTVHATARQGHCCLGVLRCAEEVGEPLTLCCLSSGVNGISSRFSLCLIERAEAVVVI
jgi:hypothetical protein